MSEKIREEGLRAGKHEEGLHAERREEAPRRRKKKKKKMSVGKMILLDLLAIAIGLVVFALFHHVLHFEKAPEPVVLATLAPQPSAEPASTPEPSAEPAAPEQSEEPAAPEETPEPVRVYSGMWGEKFADKFTDGEIIRTENSYRSANVNITVTKVEEELLIYYVADIYISDLRYLASSFAHGEYNGGIEPLADMAKEAGAIVGISGDHYYGRYEGMLVRNGVLYRDTRFQDVCVLLSDGTMVTMTNAEMDIDNVKAAAPYQVWSFGPELLDDEGKAMTSFNSIVIPKNPRSAIGYVEPGHYYFVVVDGRIPASRGMTMQELSQLFEDLGCASAYNLDGGQSSGFTWMGELMSYPYGRNVSDLIYIWDDAAESEG